MKHREILTKLIDEIVAFDPDCSILIGGSLSRGEERQDSDIDLHVWLSKEPDPGQFNDLINEDTRAHWHVCTERDGVKIDIGWRLFDALLEEIPANVAMVYYPCVLWEIARDPSGKLESHIAAMQRWLDRHPWVVEVWGKQYEDMCRHKKDPSHPLAYTEREWYAHLQGLINQRKREGEDPGNWVQ
ncbi:MAG: nucleotidyltransferase domain-containing protein [Verrucomicrobiae bacterium]